jgi:hypothetical protein
MGIFTPEGDEYWKSLAAQRGPANGDEYGFRPDPPSNTGPASPGSGDPNWDPWIVDTQPKYTLSSSPPGGAMGAAYTLPGSAAAAAGLRDLQTKSTAGLAGLMDEDRSAQRAAIQKALYDTQAEGITTASDRWRQQMLEGTFGHGVGPSSMTVELAGRGQQEHADALARAEREAFTGAGTEDRADVASRAGVYNTAFANATTGLQGEANVALTDLARQQQESQFGRNLAFQGSENSANRAQQASQFGSNLGLQYAQLGQQGSQFTRGLEFQGSQAGLNRDFAGSQAALGRDFAGSQAALGRDFQAEQNNLAREFNKWLTETGQTFTGTQADLNRAAAAAAQASSQAYQGGQNQLTRDQQMQQIILQLANQRDIAAGQQVTAGLGAAGTGLGGLFGPALQKIFA